MGFREDTLRELEELKSKGGDVYQSYADKHDISRKHAKIILFPVLFGTQIWKEELNAY